MRTINIHAKLTLFNLLQFLSLLYVIIIRPFDSVKDNILEILNDTLFFWFSLMISILKNESQWNTSLSNLVLSIIMVNGLAIGGIILIDIFVKTALSIIKKCKKKKPESENENQVSTTKKAIKNDSSIFPEKTKPDQVEIQPSCSSKNLIYKEASKIKMYDTEGDKVEKLKKEILTMSEDGKETERDLFENIVFPSVNHEAQFLRTETIGFNKVSDKRKSLGNILTDTEIVSRNPWDQTDIYMKPHNSSSNIIRSMSQTTSEFNIQRSASLVNQKPSELMKKKSSIDIQQNNLFEIQEKEESDIEHHRVSKFRNHAYSESVSHSSIEDDNALEIIYDRQNPLCEKSLAKDDQSLSLQSISDVNKI